MTSTQLGHAPTHIAPGTVLVVFRSAVGPGPAGPAHQHFRHQLSWSPTGVLQVTSGHTHWVLPPSLASWIPGGTEHAVHAHRAAELHSVWFHPPLCDDLIPPSLRRPGVIAMTDLLRSLIHHLADDTLPVAERRRAEHLLLDQLRPIDAPSTALPVPTDVRAAAVARAILADPAVDDTLDAWGSRVGASRRTLIRLFREETGLTFTAWRTQARLLAGLAHLAAGDTVAATSRRVGYGDPSSFIAAYSRHLGTTPMRDRRAGGT